MCNSQSHNSIYRNISIIIFWKYSSRVCVFLPYIFGTQITKSLKETIFLLQYVPLSIDCVGLRASLSTYLCTFSVKSVSFLAFKRKMQIHFRCCNVRNVWRTLNSSFVSLIPLHIIIMLMLEPTLLNLN